MEIYIQLKDVQGETRLPAAKK